MKSLEPAFSRRERQIMDALHTRARATAAEVQAALPDAPSYSTIRALLRILEDKGHVKHVEENGRYIYMPRASRESASRSALKRVVATFFQGSVKQALAALLESGDTKLTEAEASQLQQLIEKAKKEGR